MRLQEGMPGARGGLRKGHHPYPWRRYSPQQRWCRKPRPKTVGEDHSHRRHLARIQVAPAMEVLMMAMAQLGRLQGPQHALKPSSKGQPQQWVPRRQAQGAVSQNRTVVPSPSPSRKQARWPILGPAVAQPKEQQCLRLQVPRVVLALI